MKKNKFIAPVVEEAVEVLWRDKKRPFFGLPLSFTTYSLYPERLMIEKGIIFRQEDEVRLYRVMDLKLKQSIFQRIFGVGSLIIYSADTSSPRSLLQHIRQPREVFRLLSNQAEEERRRTPAILETF